VHAPPGVQKTKVSVVTPGARLGKRAPPPLGARVLETAAAALGVRLVNVPVAPGLREVFMALIPQVFLQVLWACGMMRTQLMITLATTRLRLCSTRRTSPRFSLKIFSGALFYPPNSRRVWLPRSHSSLSALLVNHPPVALCRMTRVKRLCCTWCRLLLPRPRRLCVPLRRRCLVAARRLWLVRCLSQPFGCFDDSPTGDGGRSAGHLGNVNVTAIAKEKEGAALRVWPRVVPRELEPFQVHAPIRTR